MMKVQKNLSCSFISRFEFAPEYYKLKNKILKLNCLISSFFISNEVYRNVKNSQLLSLQKYQKLKIIGGKYYDHIEKMTDLDRCESSSSHITAGTITDLKNIYQKKIMIILIVLIKLIYGSNDHENTYYTSVEVNGITEKTSKINFNFNITDKDQKNYQDSLRKYADVLRSYFFWRIKENSRKISEKQSFDKLNDKNKDNREQSQQEFSINTLIDEVFEMSQSSEYFNEEKLIDKLEILFQSEQNHKFAALFSKTFQQEEGILQTYFSGEQKVDYLRKKLSYKLLREIYFHLSYDNDFLGEKSINSRKNYQIYENRIIQFFDQIIAIDYQQYVQKKEQQLKKRSIHLKNYEFKYEDEPSINDLEKYVNKLICCVFNQLLNILTQPSFINSHKKPKNLPQKMQINHDDLYEYYCSAQFTKENARNQPRSNVPSAIMSVQNKEKVNKNEIINIFTYLEKNKSERGLSSLSLINTENQDHINEQNQQKTIQKVRVYTIQKFAYSQAVKIYKKLHQNDDDYSKLSQDSNRQSQIQRANLKHEPLTQMELLIIKNNESSLITMLKTELLENINQMKCSLIRKNLISKIQKLYINLDVRHKVFESFQDKILNYEMQKAKIYHQYIDYITGLKLDVYAHMAGEASLPYIKVINAVKLYRLKVKKVQLEKKAHNEFQKNLKKWNSGIQTNLENYNRWLNEEDQYWSSIHSKALISKKELLEIYFAVNKQMERQKKKGHRKIHIKSVKQFEKCTKLELESPANTQINENKQINMIKKGAAFMLSRKPFIQTAHQNRRVKIQIEDKSALKTAQGPRPKTNIDTPIENKHFAKSQYKVSATEFTKAHTRFQSSVDRKSFATQGFRGLSIKFDLKNIEIPVEGFKKNEQKRVYRQTFNEILKSNENQQDKSKSKAAKWRNFSAQKRIAKPDEWLR